MKTSHESPPPPSNTTLRSATTSSGGPATRLPLSPRELGVARFLGEDLSPAQIGAQLGISKETVRIHIRNIHQKLGVRSRHAAVAILYRLGVDPVRHLTLP